MKKLILKLVMVSVIITLVVSFSLVGCSGSGTATTTAAAAETTAAAAGAAETTAAAGAIAPGSIELPVSGTNTGKLIKNSGKSFTFAISQGWLENQSGQKMKAGYEQSAKIMGDTVTFANAAFDAKVQSEQIEAFIKTKPDALLISPCDAIAITPAVQHAIDAGIPVFTGDSQIPGVLVTTCVMSSNWAQGASNAEYIVKRLGGKGNVAIITLPANESWDMRESGMRYVFSSYPDIKIVANWVYDLTGKTTARQAADAMLAANPGKGGIDAFWCSFDEPAMDAANACVSAGRPEIFTTGIDGGPATFEMIYTQAAPMARCMAQSMWLMAAQSVYWAHKYLEEGVAPRLVITPTYAVEKDSFKNLKDLTNADTYDEPGVADLLGWVRST